MSAINIVPPKRLIASAADQQITDELNPGDDRPDIIDDTKYAVCGVINSPPIASDITDDAESVDWGVFNPPPLPNPRDPKEIINDLKKLVATDHGKCLELAREQIYAPQVMLSLAGDFAICFGGPGVIREPISLGQKTEGKLDSRDIHPTLSSIARRKDGKYFGKHSSLHFVGKHSGTHSSLPSVVLDIGRLHLRIVSHDNAKDAPMYQATDYRAVMDVISRAVWLFYEYYEIDEDESPVKVPFQKNPLTKTIGKHFDAAIALPSIEKWDDQLSAQVVKANIRKSCFMSHASIAPAVSRHVENQLEASRGIK